MANHSKRDLTSSSFESYWLKIFQLKGAPLSQKSRHWLPQDNQNPQSRSFLLFHFSKAFINKVLKICFHNRKLKRVMFKWMTFAFFLFCFLPKQEYLHHVTSWNLFSVDPLSVERVQNLTVMEGTRHKGMQCDHRHSSNNYFLGECQKWSGLWRKAVEHHWHHKISNWIQMHCKQHLWVGFGDDVHWCAL